MYFFFEHGAISVYFYKRKYFVKVKIDEGKLEHIENNGFIFRKVNENQNTNERKKILGANPA